MMLLLLYRESSVEVLAKISKSEETNVATSKTKGCPGGLRLRWSAMFSRFYNIECYCYSYSHITVGICIGIVIIIVIVVVVVVIDDDSHPNWWQADQSLCLQTVPCSWYCSTWVFIVVIGQWHRHADFYHLDHHQKGKDYENGFSYFSYNFDAGLQVITVDHYQSEDNRPVLASPSVPADIWERGRGSPWRTLHIAIALTLVLVLQKWKWFLWSATWSVSWK